MLKYICDAQLEMLLANSNGQSWPVSALCDWFSDPWVFFNDEYARDVGDDGDKDDDDFDVKLGIRGGPRHKLTLEHSSF